MPDQVLVPVGCVGRDRDSVDRRLSRSPSSRRLSLLSGCSGCQNYDPVWVP